MIAAGYTTHLYCDCDLCEGGIVYGEFCGKSWTSTLKLAKTHGWKVTKDRVKCYAPESMHRKSFLEGRQVVGDYSHFPD